MATGVVKDEIQNAFPFMLVQVLRGMDIYLCKRTMQRSDVIKLICELVSVDSASQ